jgi:hypothetical protein
LGFRNKTSGSLRDFNTMICFLDTEYIDAIYTVKYYTYYSI